MAAVISNSNGVNEMFVAGAPAWHNLGQNVSKAQTWQDAVQLAHLNWTVSKHQLQNPVTQELIPSHAIVRDDTGKWLSTVGDDYTPIQNNQCFDFVDALIESNQAHYVSAGALQGGRVVWCLAGIKGIQMEPLPGDEYKTYLLFTDYRNYKRATCKITTTRVVCNNTLNIALSGKSAEQMFFRHSGGVQAKLDAAKKLTVGVSGDIKKLSDKMKQLASTKLTEKHFTTILGMLFPKMDGEKKSTRSLNQATEIASLFQRNDDDKKIKGTAHWQIYPA
jgi:phage/plasmid-like protein (TIGR03299 family)